MRVDTEIVLLEGRPALACFRAGESIDLAALSSALGATCVRGDVSDLPYALTSLLPPIPPFGQLFGIPIILDETVNTGAAVLVMASFGGNDFFDVAFDEWARLEAPRIASFSSAGELPQHTEERSEGQAQSP
jgi:hypothetical protein